MLWTNSETRLILLISSGGSGEIWDHITKPDVTSPTDTGTVQPPVSRVAVPVVQNNTFLEVVGRPRWLLAIVELWFELLGKVIPNNAMMDSCHDVA